MYVHVHMCALEHGHLHGYVHVWISVEARDSLWMSSSIILYAFFEARVLTDI